MFFRRKNRDQVKNSGKVSAKASNRGAADDATVEGTAPDVVEASETSVLEETVGSAVISASAENGTSLAGAGNDAIRLFPGFERDDFEVGFRADREHPTLVMRWKDGDADWFAIPALFNRAVLASMDERDSASDLNRLLRNYGYDVDAIAE